MTDRDSMPRAGGSVPQPAPAQYEAPRIERVLTPVELEREILYAGDAATPVSDEQL